MGAQVMHRIGMLIGALLLLMLLAFFRPATTGTADKTVLHDISFTLPKGKSIAFVGKSGAGKSTIAIALERELFNRGMQSYVLDGDNLRYGLNANLGFSPEDRSENIRRAAEVAKLFASAGFIVITSLMWEVIKEQLS